MRYISSRNHNQSFSFKAVVQQGLAEDGGLFVPEILPDLGEVSAHNAGYQALASSIFSYFMAPDFTSEEVELLVSQSYQTFDSNNIVELERYDNHWVLELFHGPTLAFKDVALQFLGRVLHSLLERGNQNLTVVGATSGDTGGAAIAGLSGIDRCRVFMFYPKGRVSKVQELQMTCGVGDNVYPIELNSSFDEAQSLVKALFSDREFNQRHNLTAVNSINWCRIMAQMVYYFYAVSQYKQKTSLATSVSFSVPTGNFGDVLAGYYAHRCGLPVNKFIVACNSNDLLARVYNEGVFRPAESHLTLSPAMDIQVASNFERLLFELSGRNSDYIQSKMLQLKQQGEFAIEPEMMERLREKFEVYAISDEETGNKMRELADKGLLVDPHTAVGICAEERSSCENVICLSTAHPVKFSETIETYTGKAVTMPESITKLHSKPKKSFTLPSDLRLIREFIDNRK
ncbi:threonine synthase [Pleionea sediminis]|uniref:threonine synthase n=1 Tax=Pleionea sediminis TaxID=2569479 RepID=UPI001186B1FD|nr:threonine synthase [Pleionea sediminis]